MGRGYNLGLNSVNITLYELQRSLKFATISSLAVTGHFNWISTLEPLRDANWCLSPFRHHSLPAELDNQE